MATKGIELRIKGKVQGVGFRPFVWKLAQKYALCGDVNNDGQGVLIRISQAKDNAVADFLQDLRTQLPPLAQIDEIIQTEGEWQDAPKTGFDIRASTQNAMDTQIIPDAATCPACLAELFDPTNRRYRYPFINCTHCGPRFSIINAIPYDRPNTSMAKFPLCAQCEQEYHNPADRRFHAQPNACPDCGPHIWLADQQQILAHQETALQQTALLLEQGKIVAIKGIGGFHLACDANNVATVNLLRQRKDRPSKPFAIMIPSLDFLTNLDPKEQELLTSNAAPIVLLNKQKVRSICDEIAPNLREVGVMLPSNPLQHLLLHEVNCPLVMTSANASGLPPVLENERAQQELAHLADFYLFHNRDILQRADDSLVRVAFDGIETLRRARGYVPDELPLQLENSANILAMGSDLKNTFCLLKKNHAIVAQHIGDVANERIQNQLQQNIQLFQQIYQFQAQKIVVDAHQGYFSSRFGKNLAQQKQIPCQEVLHHHAHIAAVMAEHHCDQTAIGLALDGIGMGENGQLWGGECLLVNDQQCQHLGGLPPVAIAGGDLAAKQPWRNWLAHLQQFVPEWEKIMQQTCPHFAWQPLAKAIEKGINAPKISSAGRLFDAVAYSLNIAPDQLSWEGEAACQLEALAWQSAFVHQLKTAVKNSALFDIPIKNNQLDLVSFWQHWLACDLAKADKAFAFHYTLAQGFAALAKQQAQKHQCQTIVLSGGVMHNQLLRLLLKQQLAEFNVLSGQQFPMNDGGLSLGQAMIGIKKWSD